MRVLRSAVPVRSEEGTSEASEKDEMEKMFDVRNGKKERHGQTLFRPTEIQGSSNMTGTDLCVNKPHCAAAVRP